MDPLALWTSERLLAASLQAVVLVPLVWALCRLLRGMPAAVQASLWWLVALKLLLAVVPVPSLAIPILPSAPAAAPIAQPAAATLRPEPAVAWLESLVALWLGIVLVHAARVAVACLRQRRLLRRAAPWEGDGEAEVARLAALMGVRRVPPVRTSDEIDVPMVTGVARPIVLVPQGFADLAPQERAMTLCHELAHIRRCDIACGWVPAIAERMFFFHPLARLAAREYALAREAACDAAVVRALAVEPVEYGRMLLRLGVVGPAPALAAGATSPTRSSLRRRLEMLHYSTDTARASRWVLAAAACALIPLQLTARTPAAAPSPEPSQLGASQAARPVQRAEPPVASPARPVVRGQPAPRSVERAMRQSDAGAAAAQPEQSVEELHREIESAKRKMLEAIEMMVERKDRVEQDNRRLLELRQRELATFRDDVVRAQMEQLQGQLQALTRQLLETAEQQKVLQDAQRRVADQIEMLRKALEAVAQRP